MGRDWGPSSPSPRPTPSPRSSPTPSPRHLPITSYQEGEAQTRNEGCFCFAAPQALIWPSPHHSTGPRCASGVCLSVSCSVYAPLIRHPSGVCLASPPCVHLCCLLCRVLFSSSLDVILFVIRPSTSPCVVYQPVSLSGYHPCLSPPRVCLSLSSTRPPVHLAVLYLCVYRHGCTSATVCQSDHRLSIRPPTQLSSPWINQVYLLWLLYRCNCLASVCDFLPFTYDVSVSITHHLLFVISMVCCPLSRTCYLSIPTPLPVHPFIRRLSLCRLRLCMTPICCLAVQPFDLSSVTCAAVTSSVVFVHNVHPSASSPICHPVFLCHPSLSVVSLCRRCAPLPPICQPFTRRSSVYILLPSPRPPA